MTEAAEGAAWTPPVEPPPANRPEPPRSSPLASRRELAPDDLSNPFGEPAEADRLPSPSPGEASLQQVDEARLATAPAPLGSSTEAPLILAQGSTPRGSKEITAILATGLVLLSVTTFAQALRQEPRAASASSPAVSGISEEDSVAGNRFLTSAQASLLAGDYEMAAAQAQTARERLIAAGEAGKETEARWILAQALHGRGKLEEAHSICLELDDSPFAERARKLAKTLAQELRQQGRSLLASGSVDLEKGLLGPALDKGRRAESLFRRYGGTREQIASAASLLSSARRAEAGLGRQPAPAVPELPRQPVAEAPREQLTRPSRTQPRVASGSLDQPSRVPTAGARSEQPSVEESSAASVDPADLPMMNQMRRRRAGMPAGEVEPAPSSQESAEEAPADQASGRPAPVYRPARRPQESESRRGRAGSSDVLPSYSNSGGGSVY